MEELKALYYDPEHGFVSESVLYKKAKERGIKVTVKQVKEFYKNQGVTQLFAPTLTKSFNPIVAPTNSVGILQIDLMDISKFFRENDNFKFLLNVVDIFSRYAWSFPIKSKTPDEIEPHLKKVIDDIKSKYPENFIWITCDKGSEFKGSVIKLIKANNIKLFLIDPHSVTAKTKTGIVERFNQTMWNKIKRYTASNGLSFIHKIPAFLSNYNTTVHRTINAKPSEVFSGKIIPLPRKIQTSISLNIGDKVRIIIKQRDFDKKSFQTKWSEEVYSITEKKGNKYQVANSKGEIMGKEYVARELQKVNEVQQPTLIEPVIQENKKVNRKVKLQRDSKIGEVEPVTGEIEIDKRLVPKEAKRQVKDKEIDNDLVGKKVSIYWPADKKSYKGVVKSYGRGWYKVEYEDGDVFSERYKPDRWTVLN
jgi:hypothetical protein